jgi:formamidopyrimidine-DNA glycosylase
VRAGLEPAVTGATVSSVAVYDVRSLRRHAGPSEDFIDRLAGRVMLAPQRRGKFMWIPLAPVAELVEAQEALVVHLGMSGQVLLRDRTRDDPLTRIRFELDNGYRVNFVDQRIFGSMAIDALVPTAASNIGATMQHMSEGKRRRLFRRVVAAIKDPAVGAMLTATPRCGQLARDVRARGLCPYGRPLPPRVASLPAVAH